MIDVVVDRDSVAAGDDVEPHAQVWRLPDDARLGDVVVRMVEGYLAPVSGEVAWSVQALHDARVERSGTGAPRLVHGTGRAEALALVVVAPGAGGTSVTVSQLGRTGLRTRITAAVRPAATGEHVLTATYLPHGRAMPWAEFRRWVDLSDEEELARVLADRARRFPHLYDESGRWRGAPRP